MHFEVVKEFLEDIGADWIEIEGGRYTSTPRSSMRSGSTSASPSLRRTLLKTRSSSQVLTTLPR